MSESLPEYVSGTLYKAVSMDLTSWLLINPLPSICEKNYEGIRVFLFKSGDNLVISSKLSGVYTPAVNPRIFSTLPEFVRAPHRMILDGEYVPREGLFFFDVLRVDDRDLRNLPLADRKNILTEIIRGNKVESPYETLQSRGEIEKFRESAISEGSQGIIAKNPLSSYGQRDSWLKLKRTDTIDCFVIDFESGVGKKLSWSVGVYSPNGNIVNLGNVSSILEKVNVRRISLGTVVEVKFQEISDDQRLVAPFVTKINHDKTPAECLLSQIPRYVSP
ncbi:MAG: hypothetical protein ACHQ1H_09970 [Nitrososphaerales archaeon]